MGAHPPEPQQAPACPTEPIEESASATRTVEYFPASFRSGFVRSHPEHNEQTEKQNKARQHVGAVQVHRTENIESFLDKLRGIVWSCHRTRRTRAFRSR